MDDIINAKSSFNNFSILNSIKKEVLMHLILVMMKIL